MQETNNNTDTNKTKNNLLRIIIILLVSIAVVSSLIFSIKNIITKPDCTPEEAWQKMSDADTIVLEGRKSWTFARPLIEADGEVVGRFQEKGFWNTRFQIKSGNTVLKYYKFGAPELSDESTANAYTYYNSDDSIAGYAQETATTLADGTRKYVYLYYDADGTQKPYYLDETDGWKICNMEGEVQVEATFEYNMSTVYTLTIQTVGDTPVDFGDKMLLYDRFLSELKTNDLYE